MSRPLTRQEWEKSVAETFSLCVESAYKDLIDAAIKAEREKVAQWMISHGYATGHGDTTEELLKELEWQIAERTQ